MTTWEDLTDAQRDVLVVLADGGARHITKGRTDAHARIAGGVGTVNNMATARLVRLGLVRANWWPNPKFVCGTANISPAGQTIIQTRPGGPPVQTPRHPAKFSKPILAAIRKMLVPEAERVGHLTVFDPFAGVGGVHELAEASVSTVGVELQPEWAAAHSDTIVGDATALPADWSGRFGAMVTSPCYGNRMADSHEAKDRCKTCDGVGHLGPATNADPKDYGKQCPTCRGVGLSRRNTYAHALREAGADVEPGSAAVLQWGAAYRAFHERAWAEADRCLMPGALAIVNVSNHERNGSEQRVVEFHLNVWLLLGYTVHEVRRVQTQRNKQGANRDARVDAEMVVAMRKRP